MNKIKYIVASTLFLICSYSFAASGTYKFNQVGIVVNNGTTYALLHIDGDLTSTPDCADGNSRQLSVVLDSETGSYMYSTILAAVASGQNVWVSYSDSNCGLWGNRVIASRFDLRNY